MQSSENTKFLNTQQLKLLQKLKSNLNKEDTQTIDSIIQDLTPQINKTNKKEM